ncbi:MAG: outer membrane lipoprotein-sorting protein [Halanaerobiales bacterium]
MKKQVMIMFLFMVCILILSGAISAENLSGNDILKKVEEAMGANTSYLNLTMTLYNSSGDSRERELEIYRKEGEKDKTFIKFLSPATIKGTAFLALEEDEDSDMYLFMPALGSERRIAGSQKNSSFVGSDFSYNDLAIIGGGNYTSDYKSESLEFSNEIYKLKLLPIDEDIEYKYVFMWINADKWYPTKMEFYNSDEKLQKVLTTGTVYEDNDYLIFEDITMEDLEKGSKTKIVLNNVTFELELDDNIFTVRHLKR